MKTDRIIHNLFILLLTSVILSYGCSKERKVCITGNVIGYEDCYIASLIDVKDNINLGRTVRYYDILTGKDSLYNNLIRVQGILPKGKIFFTLREYNSDKDFNLFIDNPPKACLQNAAPYNTTTYIILKYSQFKCPENEK